MSLLPSFLRPQTELESEHDLKHSSVGIGAILETDPSRAFMVPPGSDPRDYAPRTERMSDAAAEAKQHMLDLEAKLNSRTSERDAALIRCQLLEGANEMLHDDLNASKNAEAYFRDRCVRHLSILEIIASNALKGIKEDKNQVLVDTHHAAKEHRRPEPEADAKAASISIAEELKSLAKSEAEQPANWPQPRGASK